MFDPSCKLSIILILMTPDGGMDAVCGLEMSGLRIPVCTLCFNQTAVMTRGGVTL